jgi:hypothetical protein
MYPKLPLGESRSLMISAACHPAPDEVDPHLAKVQWGSGSWDGGGGTRSLLVVIEVGGEAESWGDILLTFGWFEGDASAE